MLQGPVGKFLDVCVFFRLSPQRLHVIICHIDVADKIADRFTPLSVGFKLFYRILKDLCPQHKLAS